MEDTLIRSRADSLDMLLKDMRYGIDDLVALMVERRTEKAATGIHTLNGNAMVNLRELLGNVILYKVLLPIGICAEIGSYTAETPTEKIAMARRLSGDLLADEEVEWDAFKRFLSGEVPASGAIAVKPAEESPATPPTEDKKRWERASTKLEKPMMIRRAEVLEREIKKLGINNTQLARRAEMPSDKDTKSLATMIGMFRNGKASISDAKAAILAKALGISLEEMLARDEPAET